MGAVIVRPAVCFKHSKWMASCTDCKTAHQPLPVPRRAA